MGNNQANTRAACSHVGVSGWLWAGQLTCVLCLFLLAAAVPLSAFYLGIERALIWGTGLGALVLLLLPSLYSPSYDLFQPLSFVLLTTLIGVTLRSAMLVFSRYSDIQEVVHNHPLEFLLPGGMAILVGLGAFLAGYVVKTPAIPIERLRIVNRTRWSAFRLWILALLFVATAGVSMVLIVKKLGIVIAVLSDISAKRNYLGSGVERAYAALGYLRLGASLVKPAFYMLLAWFATSGKSWFSLNGLVVFLTGIMACFYPLMSSSRTGVVTILIVAMVIWHYLRRAIRIRALVVALMLAVAAITIMTAFRQKVNEPSALSAYLAGRRIAEILILNDNFLGIVKTSAIMEALPGRLDHEYGKTFLLWLVSPIPRSMWEDKPIISVGEVIGNRVYGSGSDEVGGGVPPGLVGELIWNFGVIGMPVGMFLLGILLRLIYRTFRNHLGGNRNALLIYVSMIIPLALDIPGGNFSGSMIQLIMDTAVICAGLAFIGRRERLAGEIP